MGNEVLKIVTRLSPHSNCTVKSTGNNSVSSGCFSVFVIGKRGQNIATKSIHDSMVIFVAPQGPIK